MIRPPQLRFCPVLAAALVLLAACSDDPIVTGPESEADEAAPTVTITSAPTEGLARQELTVSFTAADEMALGQVTCSWGTPDTPADLFEASGATLSGSCSHTYTAPGQYTIVVRARDAAGNEAERQHAIEIDEPLPSTPTNVSVSLVWNEATVWWTPVEAATTHHVVVSHVGGLEPDRAETIVDRAIGSLTITGLSWDTSYEVVVVAENGSGRAESAPVRFETQMPEPPVLTHFSTPAWTVLWYGMGGNPDPTCLFVEWTPTHNSLEYRVVVDGLAAGNSFEYRVEASATNAILCAADYPIMDGATYEAQVFAVGGSEEFGSGIRETTTDFDPEYAATGTWSGLCGAAGFIESCDMTLDLVDTDGAVTGAWTRTCQSGSDGGPLSGTRTDWRVDLPIQDIGAYTLHFSGVFYTADRIKAFYGIDGLIQVCTLDRQ